MAERDDEGFLARWSRRKQAARAAEGEPGRRDDAPPPTRAADVEAPERSRAADPTPDLPDPETLDASSDFSVFLGRDVPIETHRQALRRLWRLDPIYNRVDGLDDYCEDYTDTAKVVKGLRTAYKVGRGLLEQIGDAEARPDQAPRTAEAGDEAERIAAASDDPTPPGPDIPAPQPDPSAPQKRHEELARTPEKGRPRPLPKRG